MLNGVVDANGAFRETEKIPEPGVGNGGNTGGTVARKVYRHPVGRPVIQGSDNALAGGHDMLQLWEIGGVMKSSIGSIFIFR